jgi:predicted nucleic acid-binding Zn ribbon protein
MTVKLTNSLQKRKKEKKRKKEIVLLYYCVKVLFALMTANYYKKT